MGTNYYLIPEPPCECCGRGYEPMHIGKSSGGWCFSLHVYPEDSINTLEDWERVWADKEIEDEYGRKVSHEEMLAIITDRSREGGWGEPPWGYNTWTEFHSLNHSLPGPNGMLRARIDGRHCIGHGPGTYDYIYGEFS